MGHKGSMEARYTTNKGVLPDILLGEMRKAFVRSEECLDQTESDPILEQRLEAQQAIGNATPEQLERVLETLQMSAICAKPASDRQCPGREADNARVQVHRGTAQRQSNP